MIRSFKKCFISNNHDDGDDDSVSVYILTYEKCVIDRKMGRRRLKNCRIFLMKCFKGILGVMGLLLGPLVPVLLLRMRPIVKAQVPITSVIALK